MRDDLEFRHYGIKLGPRVLDSQVQMSHHLSADFIFKSNKSDENGHDVSSLVVCNVLIRTLREILIKLICKCLRFALQMAKTVRNFQNIFRY